MGFSIKVSELEEKFDFRMLTDSNALENATDNDIQSVYIGDLLSWVMSKAEEHQVWVTIQGHVNIIAVANLTSVSCILIAENAEIEPETINKANMQGIPLFATELSSYEVAKLFAKLE